MSLKALAELVGVELVVPLGYGRNRHRKRLHFPSSTYPATTVCGNVSDARPATPAEVAELDECRACVLFTKSRESSLYRGPRPPG